MISVVVPIYNVETYLEECLASIVNQTYKNLEIICVNDCTLDNSVNIVKKFMQRDSRIRLINHERNRGLGGARNTGIQEAKGNYITFVDSDDVLDLTMLEKMESIIREENIEAVVCGIRRFVDNTVLEDVSTFHRIKNPRSGIYCVERNKGRLTDIWPSAGNKLYKTEIIKKFNLQYQENLLYEDHFFFYAYFCHVNRFYYIGEPLYNYRAQRPGSITSTVTGRENEVYIVLDSLKEVFESSFGDSWKYVYEKICFRLTWERQFIIWGNMNEWLKYTKNAEQWLKNHFSLDELSQMVDKDVNRTDPFYRYIFLTGIKKQLFKLKLTLMKSKHIALIRSFLYRIKNFRSTRSLVKELIWLSWNSKERIDALTQKLEQHS